MTLGFFYAALATSLLFTPVHAMTSTECHSNCSQTTMSCNMTCKGSLSCLKSCGAYLNRCTKACMVNLQSDNPLKNPFPSQAQEPSKAPDELDKIDKFIDGIQGIIGGGK